MKTKFHLTKRSPSRHGHANAPESLSATQAVALVDERFLGWMAGRRTSGNGTVRLQRHNLMPVLADLLRQSAPDLQLQRTYLFAESQLTELLDDVVVRVVPQHSSDGGLGGVRAMGLELTQLAQFMGHGTVLVVSDDERLIPYIDEAQWRGLKVVLVSDDSTQDMTKLMHEDPSWSRLLMQADRRLILGNESWDALTQEGVTFNRMAPVLPLAPAPVMTPRQDNLAMAGNGYFNSAPPSQDWLDQVRQVVEAWWREETPHARLDLYEEMQNSQGVPPETDRHLLLRVRRELARTLSFHEKKAMREMIRTTVLAHPPSVDEGVSS